MRQSWSKAIRWMTSLAFGGLLLAGGCELQPNFWSIKESEVLNRTIFGLINAILGAFTGGGIQI